MAGRPLPGRPRRWLAGAGVVAGVAMVSTLATLSQSEAATVQPPSLVRAVAVTPSQVVVEWEGGGGPAKGFVVRRDGRPIARLDANSASFTDDTGAPGAKYDYTVETVGARGDASSPRGTRVKTPAPPDLPDRTPPTTPDDVEAVSLSSGQVLVVWQYASDDSDVSAYTVFRGDKRIAVLDAGTFRYIDHNPGRQNEPYRVQAVDSVGTRSKMSDPANVQPATDAARRAAAAATTEPPSASPSSAAVLTPQLAAAAVAYLPALRRYPYLTDVVNSNDGTIGYATVNWATDRSATTARAVWGAVAPDGSCTPTTPVAASRTGIQVNAVNLYQWKAPLVLAPDKQYCYRVQLGATNLDLLGGDASPRFRTMPQAGSTAPISFAVLGDWGSTDANSANPDQAALMASIANSGVRFAITTGDNAYSSGSQNNYGDLVEVGPGLSSVFGPQFWTVAGASIPMFPAMGNHGFQRSDAVHPHFNIWPQDQAVATSSGRYQKDIHCCLLGTPSLDLPSAWYAFDAGPARVYVLHAAWADTQGGVNGDPYEVDAAYHWTPGSPEYQWLQQDLASHPGQVKLVSWHYPLYSDQKHENSDTFLQAQASLAPLLSQYGVKLAFNGHAHIYQRNNPDAGGLVSYVTGGGGALVQSVGEDPCNPIDAYAIGWSNSRLQGNACGSAPAPTSASQVYHYLKVTVSPSQVTVTPVNALGQVFDSQTYNVGAGDNQAPTVPTAVTAAADSSSQVTVSWAASTDNTAVAGYDVRRDGAVVGSVNAPATVFTDTTVSPSTNYSYDVRAKDAANNLSAFSAPPASVTTPAAPAGGSVTVNPVADSYVDASVPATNFGAATTLAADTSPAQQRTFLRFNVAGVNGPVTDARVRLLVTNSTTNAPALASTTNTWTELGLTWANQPAATTTLSNVANAATGTWIEYPVTAAVTGNGSYDFVLLPESSDGLAVASREAVAANRPQLVVTFGPGGADNQPPTAPSNVTAAPGASVTVSWTASVDNVAVASYDVLRDGSVVGTVGGSVTSYLDGTVAPSTSYTYQVRARDIAGNVSALSNSAAVTTPANAAPVVFTPIADSYTDSATPAVNFGAATTLSSDTSPSVQRTYLRFNVSGFSGTVASAVVRVFVTNASTNAPALATTASTWTEPGLTDANAPAPGPVLANVGAAASGTWISYTVTGTVTGNGTFDFVLVPESSDGLGIASREAVAANRPQLVLTPA